MNNLWIWALSVLVMAIAFALFFGLIVGERGWTLAVAVVLLPLLFATIIYLRRRSLRSR
jgi:hypothetical protein